MRTLATIVAVIAVLVAYFLAVYRVTRSDDDK
jgi:hypothetical protein